jgi:parvulin-like peptidyl-prolyl isomerase
VWWGWPVRPALGRKKQEDGKFKTSPSCRVRPFKMKTKPKQKELPKELKKQK